MGFIEDSVLQLLMKPWTTDRTTLISPLSNARSLHRRPNSSLRRSPVVASIKSKIWGNASTAPRSWRISSIDKDMRYRAAFSTLANELDGVAVKEFVSASMIKQHAHDVLDLRARRAGQGK